MLNKNRFLEGKLKKELWSDAFAVSDIKGISLANRTGKSFYCEDEKILLKINRDTWSLTDIEKAMTNGKELRTVSIDQEWNCPNCDLLNELGNLIQNSGLSLREILNGIYEGTITFNKLYVNRSTAKSNEVYTPFYKEIKKLNLNTDKKLNKLTLIKILKHKGTRVIRKGKYTDDYAFDNATNYGRGELNRERILFETVQDYCKSNYMYYDQEDKNKLSYSVANYDYMYMTFEN